MTSKTKKFFSYLILILFSAFSVFPMLYMHIAATNTSTDVIRGRMIPGTYMAANFTKLVTNTRLTRAMGNSFRNAIILTLLSLAVCSIAGYGFEIYHTKGKDKLMSVILLAMMVPFVTTLVPLFELCSKMGLLNTAAGFVLPTISTPFLIMMFRQSARSFPHDIIEAARIDGLNEFQIFVRMFIPTMRSTYAAAMTVTFMNAWNSYLWPKVIMTKQDAQTMPMLIADLISGYVTDYGELMLAVLLCTLPTVIVFFFLQKYFAEGITGAVK